VLVTFADRIAGWGPCDHQRTGRPALPHTRKPERRIGLSALPLVRLSGRLSACVFGIYVELFVGDGLLVTLCHHGQAFLAAIAEVWRRSRLG
jgi:hypothetical protein